MPNPANSRRYGRARVRLMGVAVCALAVVAVLGSEASAAWYTSNPGPCPVNAGTYAGSVCIYLIRNPDDNVSGRYSASDSNFSNDYFGAGGATANDNNNDTTNGEAYSVEVCNNSNYGGGVDINLNPGYGIAQSSSGSTGSSVRAVTNGCNG